MSKLNLGCGRRYLPGYINCDVSDAVKTDLCFDLNSFPYPFEDETADEIRLEHVLEHLPDTVAAMCELHRILRVGGVLRIWVPYAKSDWAFGDPTHRSFFTEQTFDYFTRGHTYEFYSPARFRKRCVKFYTDSPTWRHKLRDAIPFRPVLRYFLWNLYDSIYAELEKTES